MFTASRRMLHWVFEASVLLKGIFASFETLFGVLLLTPLSLRALHFLQDTGLHRAIADPDDRLAHFLTHHLNGMGREHLHFWAIYMIGHGLVKLCVVVALMKEWYSAFPFAMLVLAGFIGWQMLDWWHTGSIVMVALSAFDAFIIWLTWREWRARANQTPATQ
ncbi:DUF2127 domain-containing protein [Paracoccus aminophilus]|uniref:DUF2127 domain-containing protein n=1 Tax=Paracoccus aminophilus JCM 7686 TaxID=1367847 RepID=S5Y941_PARAH|nr:DUF2127 domain-containing protein [Paracoccus aminophilus]AGT07873.1 hypothetical protein JCM7686_0764 [Paracoccus aminophilus JCM 7686]